VHGPKTPQPTIKNDDLAFDHMVHGIWLGVLPAGDDFNDLSSASMKQDWEHCTMKKADH
jgi:hypothetical protein